MCWVLTILPLRWAYKEKKGKLTSTPSKEKKKFKHSWTRAQLSACVGAELQLLFTTEQKRIQNRYTCGVRHTHTHCHRLV